MLARGILIDPVVIDVKRLLAIIDWGGKNTSSPSNGSAPTGVDTSSITKRGICDERWECAFSSTRDDQKKLPSLPSKSWRVGVVRGSSRPDARPKSISTA
jgi:hypothetical protein